MLAINIEPSSKIVCLGVFFFALQELFLHFHITSEMIISEASFGFSHLIDVKKMLDFSMVFDFGL